MGYLFAGLDVSTQSCKLVVIDLNAAKIVYVATVNYDEDLPEFGTKNGVVQGMPEGVSESMWLTRDHGVGMRLSSCMFVMFMPLWFGQSKNSNTSVVSR